MVFPAVHETHQLHADTHMQQAYHTHTHPLCVGRDWKKNPPTAMFKLSSSKQVPG